MHYVLPRRIAAFLICFGFCSGGCVFGPAALTESRMRYNEAIRRTSNEQLLLNLVRLRYRDVPFVLDVGSVSAQFEFRQSADVSGTLNENVGPNPSNPDSLDLGGGISFADRPTVTFSPVQGQEFVRQLMTPLSIDTLLLLQRSGWSLERVLRLCVQNINGVDNATRASGPTPPDVPPYEDFLRVTELIRTLQLRRQIAFGYRTEEADLSDPLSTTQVTGEDLILAAKEGYTFRRTPQGGAFVLRGVKQTLELRIARAARKTPEAAELLDRLSLAPGSDRYPIEFIGTDVIDREPNPPGFKRILLGTRALLGMFFYLSQGIEIPESHREDGLVTITRTEAGDVFDWKNVTGDLLQVHSQRTPPRNAAVSVRYRGYWFYIDDTDLNSKSTFTLLAQLASLQAGVEAKAGPLLTIPIGG